MTGYVSLFLFPSLLYFVHNKVLIILFVILFMSNFNKEFQYIYSLCSHLIVLKPNSKFSVTICNIELNT